MKVFITGDRSLNPHTAFHAAQEAVAKAFITYGADTTFITGDSPTGVEAAVRYLLVASRQPIEVLETPFTAGKRDYAKRNAVAAAASDVAVVIHTSPLDSTSVNGLFAAFSSEKVVLIP